MGCEYCKSNMETLKSFLVITVVILCFGVAVITGQNGLLSARCAARCLTEHKDRIRKTSDRNNHRKFMLDRCKTNRECFQCMKPCASNKQELMHNKCDNVCENGEKTCEDSCEFLYYTYMYKAGDCPKPESAKGFEAACLASCRTDGDCDDDSKCCPNLCGYVCRKPDYSKYNLPGVPKNFTFEEKRQGRALYITWDVPEKIGAGNGVRVYIVEQRNTTNLKPVGWNEDTYWEIKSITAVSSLLLERVHAGHWYQYRVAMVTSSGTQGYSPISEPFKSSRRVQRPDSPQNITEGATTLRKGLVDVTIHWMAPKYSDIPIWKYSLTWSERLTQASPVLVRIPVLEKTLPGNIHEFKLDKLKPGTTYHIQIEALIRHGNRELISNRASKYITTYSPPNMKQDATNFFVTGPLATFVEDKYKDNAKQVYSVYADIIKVGNLEVLDGIPYFDKGSLKAQLQWSVSAEFSSLVKSFLIFWFPQSCEHGSPVSRHYSATSDAPRFEIYDLQYQCQYVVRVSGVTRKGVQSKPAEVKLRTPVCERIQVKGDSLPPECPKQSVLQLPKTPREVSAKILHNNCSIDIQLRWKHPPSDAPIENYVIEYEMTDGFKGVVPHTEATVYKRKPIEIRITKVRQHTLHNLTQEEVYLIKLRAVSRVGAGEPAIVEVSPRIQQCGSEKDGEPPDLRSTIAPTTVLKSTELSSTVDITTVSLETVTKYRISKNSTDVYRTTQYSSTQITVSNVVHVGIYKTVYYMFYFFYMLFTKS
ncbi:anosmin-1-like [Dreissena polymorpha]|uniref:anosmin-1-like n=1 Tax=Dreissena polymorpha TaxID=45954 RepID=UPI0022654005|nr:anosmin-1-like [Dreissena polymorpha]